MANVNGTMNVKLYRKGVGIMEDSLLLVVFNRIPLENEIEQGVGEDERMIDSTIVQGDDTYNQFIESEEAQELDFNVTAIHRITEEGHIIGLV